MLTLALLLIGGKLSAQMPGGTVENLGPMINSADDDYSPWMSRYGDTLIFTSSRRVPIKAHKAKNAEIMRSVSPRVRHCDARQWEAATIFDSVMLRDFGLRMNEGALTVSRDESFAVFAAERVTSSGISAYDDLFQVSLGAGLRPIGTPVALTKVNEAETWESQPSLSPDGTLLFFVSNRKRADGKSHGLDIYVSTIESGRSWGVPQLVTQLSTDGDDVTPFAVRGGLLYFSSNGDPDGAKAPAGLGAKDIFVTKYRFTGGSLQCEKPQRLPAPYNSDANDISPCFTSTGDLFVFASDRKGGAGGYDLYASCQYTQPKLALRMNLRQRWEDDPAGLTSAPIVTAITLHDATSGTDTVLSPTNDGQVIAPLRAEHSYSINPAQVPCLHGPENIAFVTARPESDTEYTANLEFVSIKQHIGLRTDTVVPFFVTGYWYPNTPDNYQRMVARASQLDTAKYIWPVWRKPEEPSEFGDSLHVVNYPKTSLEVEHILEHSIYSPMDILLRKMNAMPCNDSGLVLKIAVSGFTDERGLNDGKYRDDTVMVDGVVIDSSKTMNRDGASGNKYLSKVRAYFTIKTIDDYMKAHSPDYARLKSAGRVVFECTGNGVDPSEIQRAFKRRVDIRVELIDLATAAKSRQEFGFVNERLGK